jgi:hypothetical protein
MKYIKLETATGQDKYSDLPKGAQHVTGAYLQNLDLNISEFSWVWKHPVHQDHRLVTQAQTETS